MNTIISDETTLSTAKKQNKHANALPRIKGEKDPNCVDHRVLGAGQLVAVANTGSLETADVHPLMSVFVDSDSEHSSISEQHSAKMSATGSDGSSFVTTVEIKDPPAFESYGHSATQFHRSMSEETLDDNMALHFSMPSHFAEGGINDLKDVAPSSEAVPNDASRTGLDKLGRVILNLPTDRPRATMGSADEAQWPFQLSKQLTQSLKSLAQEHDMGLSAILLAAWSAVLSRLSDQREFDISIQGLVLSPQAKTAHRSAYSSLRIDLAGDPSMVQLLERLKRAAQDSRDDQLDIKQVAFSFSREEELSAAGQEKRSPKVPEGGFNLELNLKDEAGQIVGIMSYATALFDSITIERHVGYLGLMLEGMASDAMQLVSKVDIISPAERLLLLNTWNNQPTVHLEFPTIHQFFEDQVKRTPSVIALVQQDQEITYADLNARSNSLAHQLIQLGVRPDTRVAICVGRSIAMIVGMLAILKAGGAYVPLDPSHASDRLVDILLDASPVCVVADQAGLRSLGDAAASSLVVVDPDTSSTHLVSDIIVPSLNSCHLAYIIFTSGTTGKPKGVMIEHQGVVSCVITQQQTLQIQSSSRVTQFFSVAFDVSVLEIFGTLCFGGSLHLLQDDVRMDIGTLWRYVERHRITHVMLTPTVFQYCDKLAPLNTLSTLIVCGESLSGALVRKLHNLVPRGTIFNMYGPTEATVVTTAWKCSMDALQDTPLIGRPLSNTTIYVLDVHCNPVPLGAIGEIFIGGIGVARGYLNRPDLTAEKFLADPFSGETGARMYRTGDLGKYLPDGNLMHLGRNDHQIKIRGFRIELGEIEARLHELPMVSEAVVIALGEGSNKRLVAYVIMKATEDARPSIAILRSYLAAKLPEYMIPAAFVRLTAFPLTTNGKLDRRALPSPSDNDYSRQRYEVPQGAVELALASVWSDLLNVKEVSRHDSFFALGGHSLLAIQMISRLSQLGHSISVRSLFESYTLSMLAQSVGHHLDVVVPPNLISPNVTRITPELLPLIDLSQTDIERIYEHVPGGMTNIQDIYALSPLQDGVLFHHMMARSGDPYVLYVSMSFRSRKSLDRYLGAIQQVVKRHDSLRTAFLYKDLSTPAQVVLREAPLSIIELELDPAAGSATEQLKQMFDPRCYRMDLTQAPLLRVVVARQVDGTWVLVELLHHLIGDHSTLEIMQSEIQSFLKGQGNSLPPAQPYRNLIAQARLGMSQGEHEEFFKEMLADIDTPSLPFGIADVHGDGTEIIESSRMLPQDTNDRLRSLAKRLGVSVASLCHVAWALVVARTSGQQRVVFGTVLFGRMQAATSSDRAMGLFINTLPIRVDLVAQSVEESVRSTHSRLAALLEHEHASLALAQRCSSVDTGVSLFSSVLNYRHDAMPPENEETADGMKLLEAHERTNYPFCLSVEDYGVSLGVTTQVIQPFDADRVCVYMQEALESLAGALEDNPNIPVARLEVLPKEERQLLLKNWNSTEESYPDDICLHHLFEQQVERTPEAIAVVHESQSLSYAELNTRANSLAHQLIALGVQPDSPVAMCVERSPSLIIGILAILKAGGAYVPLDPSHASDRLVDILLDASPVCVVADQAGLRSLGDTAASSLVVVDPDTSSTHLVSNIIVPSLNSCHLAYIIFTSGTTGKPKGVMIEHQGVVSCVATQQRTLQIQSSSRVTQFFSVAFDVSVLEIFSTLCFGGSLHLLQDDVRMDIGTLWRYVERHRITHVMLTPTVFQYCDKLAPLNTLSTLIVCGESLSGALVRKLLKLVPRGTIFNMYGPTETTVVTTAWKCSGDALQDTALIGRPLPNRTIYVLDAHGNPVPLGAVGEIFIGGIGVARGYLNRPDLTAEKFLADTFSGENGTRMYRTGDLGKYLPDGNLMHLGRTDHQVKIRGFRVELGEIEARLHEHPLVSEAVINALGEGSNKRLIAYVIMRATADNGTQSIAIIRSHLAATLPEYMIPAAFVRLHAFPLTTNGKLDRRALPSPGDNDYARQSYEAPQGAMELALASIWSDLLNVKEVSRHDSFFALGGHSLLAIQMISRLSQLGHSISVRSLFESPSLLALAQSVGHHRAIIVPRNVISPNVPWITPEMLPLIELSQVDINRIIERVLDGVTNIQDIYALSPLQDGILFHYMMARSGDPYVLSLSTSFDTRASLDRYLGAIQQVVKRHDSLRTVFLYKDLSTPAQVVLREAPLSVTELELDPAAGYATEQLKQMFDPRCYRMDLTQAPLLRVVVARQVDGTWVLVELLHHLIGDHSTLEIMQSEIQSFLKGQGNSLPPAQPYRNLIAQARLGMSQGEHEEFFKEMLADIDTPSLPFGIADVHGDGTEIIESSRMLPQDTNDRLRSLAKRLGVSVASLCHVAWALVVARTSGQQRVVFGTVLFGRMQAATSSDRAMGLFINVLPIRVDLVAQIAEENVRSTHSRLAALLEHEHASLALAQRCSSVAAGVPLFSSILNYRHNAMPSVDEQISPGMKVLESQERSSYPFCLSVEDYGTTLGVTTQAIRPFDADRVCGYMQEVLESLVGALENGSDMPVVKLEVLPKEERQLLLKDWNSTQDSYSEDICLHHVFEQQVKRTPEAVAVVHEGLSLSYTELNTRANSLAHRLIALGVQPDSPVAICVERSPAMIISILAILKAGGAYVPLDPSHASGRLLDILRDTSPVCIVADQVGLGSLGEGSSSTPVVDPCTISAHPISNILVPTLTSHHLAYIIFTSGTTDRPKGVMMEHQGIVSHISSQQQNLQIQPSTRMTQFFSLGFDGSVLEIFSTLCFGGCLYILSDDVRKDIGAMWRYLDQHHITHVILTPSVVQSCDMLAPLTSLSTLLFGGESLPAALAQTLRKRVPNGRILNQYGPTETTVAATSWICPEQNQDEFAPIGRPLANKTIYLLDSNHQPVPLGAVGEIFIGGKGIARGYLNRPDLTAERFLQDPYAEDSEGRIYRTGDLARYLPDGNLVYMGRNDQQVKVRGFRIELGEIEARLVENPLVSEAVVVASGEGGDKRLVAYVVTRHDAQSEQPLSTDKPSSNVQMASILRSHLVTKLPEHMIPAAFVCIDNFPLTPNGKLDRNALPAPTDDAFALQAHEAPKGDIENILSTIWGELLSVERVGRHDSFFVLGGHSLLAVRMIGRIRSMLGFEISLRTLFEAPTIAQLAPRLLTTGAAQKESYDVLLPIRPQGTRPALFCVHPSLGLSWCFTGLATHLDPEQPLYGLQARGFIEGESVASTLEEMVLDYIDQIRRIQPHGPYHLLGYSFGGLVAHTMASYLEEQGERVALVALMDTPADYHTQDLNLSDDDEIENGVEQILDVLVGNRESSSSDRLMNPFLEKALMLGRNHLWICHAQAPRVIRGDIVIFHATVLEPGKGRRWSPEDWRPHVLGNIEVCEIECSHMEMVLPEPLSLIAQVLNKKLK